MIDLDITIDRAEYIEYSVGYTGGNIWEPYNITTDNWQDGLTMLSISARDKFGNTKDGCFNFTVDGTGPSVVSTYPLSDEIDAIVDSSINITFSEPVNISSVIGSVSIFGTGELGISDYVWSENNSKVTIELVEPLEDGTEYSVTVYSSIKDEVENFMKERHHWSFTTWLDTDNDGEPDTTDEDDDGDGYLDSWENFLGTDPTDPEDMPLDTDGDGIPDGNANNTQSWMDIDDDNDGVLDSDDFDPLDPKITGPPGISLFWSIMIGILVALLVLTLFLAYKYRPKGIQDGQEIMDSGEEQPKETSDENEV